MSYSLLSLVENGPPGFEFRTVLSQADTRRWPFALFAPSLEVARQQLEPWMSKITGVVMTEEAEMGWNEISPGVYHWRVSPELRSRLKELVVPCLQFLSLLRNKAEDYAELDQLFVRCQADRERLKSEFSEIRTNLVKEIQERKRSEEKFFKVFKTSLDGITINRLSDGMYLEVNDGFSNVTGYRLEEVRGKLPTQVELWVNPEQRRKLIRDLHQTESVTGVEAQFRCKNGKIVIGMVSARIIDFDGVPCLFCMTRDITERKQIEEDRLRLIEQANTAIQLRDEFLSVASHELKTPMTPLMLQLQMALRLIERLRTDVTLVEKLENSLKIAGRSMTQLTQLVDELLDVSRIANGKLSLNLESVGLRSLTQQVLETFSEQLQKVGCPVEVRMPEELVGRWDRLRMEQVLTNLLTNAMKYGKGKKIEIEVRRKGDQAVFSIRDHGIGIAPENHARVFGRFERAVSGKSYSGLGLGLFVSQRIIDAHGGSIEIESALNQGSLFTVKVPLG